MDGSPDGFIGLLAAPSCIGDSQRRVRQVQWYFPYDLATSTSLKRFASGVSRPHWSPVERTKPPPVAHSSISRLAFSSTCWGLALSMKSKVLMFPFKQTRLP